MFDMNGCMVQVQGNVGKINKCVKGTILPLKVRGHKVNNTDLMAFLFKEYEVNLDKKINPYMFQKKDVYKEFHEIIPDKLMKFVSSKYLTLVEKGLFNKPLTVDEN